MSSKMYYYHPGKVCYKWYHAKVWGSDKHHKIWEKVPLINITSDKTKLEKKSFLCKGFPLHCVYYSKDPEAQQELEAAIIPIFPDHLFQEFYRPVFV